MSNNTTTLNIIRIRGIVSSFTSLIIGIVIFFGFAGTLYWVRGWIYFCYLFSYQIFFFSILLIVNPQLLNERGKFNLKETKRYDKYFIISYHILWPSMLIVAGLNVRFQWSSIPFIAVYPSIVVIILTSCIALWAQISNSHFIITSRNDKLGNQQICTTGPYRYIRHPGYFSAIFQWLCYPLILGSWFSFIPALIYISCIIIRTYYEDKTLKIELKGYEEYSKMTKYRLFPYLW
jgi:protein-S-isoprenylcysteine O-methyltransferase Ste14